LISFLKPPQNRHIQIIDHSGRMIAPLLATSFIEYHAVVVIFVVDKP
jgi:hypothetical protein